MLSLNVAGMVAALACGDLAKADERDEGFRQGLSAFQHGDYHIAMNIWQPLAQSEDPRSQASIGFMYDRGLGVAMDLEQAAYWYRRAAEHGQAEGQAMLGRLYLRGRGVPQSSVVAFAWCELAADRGGNGAGGCRSMALQQMKTHEEMLSAFQLTTTYRQRYAGAK